MKRVCKATQLRSIQVTVPPLNLCFIKNGAGTGMLMMAHTDIYMESGYNNVRKALNV